MRRLASLLLGLCTACGGEVEPATPPPPSLPSLPSRTADVPPVAKGHGPVGTWTIDEDARQALVATARRTLDARLEDRLAALPATQRARASDAAEAAEAAKAQALRALEGLALTLEIRADGTAVNRIGLVGKDRDTACTWTEEGGLLVLSRVDGKGQPMADDRALRFRRDADTLTWERPDVPGRPATSLTLRRR